MRTFRLGFVTWNVGGAVSPLSAAASRLLRVAAHCDVVVVGLQEVPVARRPWTAHLAHGLGPSWRCVAAEAYAGLRLRVYAREAPNVPRTASVHFSPLQHARRAHDAVRATGSGRRVGVGVADRWPNKGAVAVEVSFGHGCRAMFVVAHLAANEHRVQGREDDWRAILRRLDKDERSLSRGAEPVIPVPLFHRYEHVFVLGDLNYRIEPPGTDHAERVKWVRQKIVNRDWHALVDADQLMREKMGDKVFANFQEADIHFPPTFKIDPKTAQYSTIRVPSYCDRILWHSLPGRIDLVKSLRYTSLTDFKQSDHIPLYGEYELRVPFVVAPDRPLNALKGKRLVLEFMLVRFVKGPGKFADRISFTDGPPSMRRIYEPGTLRIPPIPPTTDGLDHARFLRTFMGRDEDDDTPLLPLDEVPDDDEDDEDDDDDDDDDDTTVSSDAEDNCFYPRVDENVRDSYNSYGDLPPGVEAEDLRNFGSPLVSSDEPRPEAPLLRDAFRHISLDTSESAFGDGSSMPNSPFPHAHPRNFLDGFHTAPRSAPTTPSTSRDSQRPIAHANSGPRKRDSLSKHVENNTQNKKVKKRRRLNGMRMEVHGQGLFLKQGRVYRVSIPKRVNGARERIGESLPVIPLLPIENLAELQYRHVLVEFAKKKTRVGTSGALALRELLDYIGRPFAFELSLTKYGHPVGILEACVQLTVSDSDLWVDAKGRVVRNCDGTARRFYRGVLPVRKKTRARSKAGGKRS